MPPAMQSTRARVPLAWPRRASPWAQAALAPLLALVGYGAPKLWTEWQGLQRDWRNDRLSRAVGYVDIGPMQSMAERPADWLLDRGDMTLLWAGWDHAAGQHTWFSLGRGELDRARLTPPCGRDVIRTIDRTLVEVGDGPRWRRLQPEAELRVVTRGCIEVAYPLVVLERVWAVNDTVDDQPVLITCIPVGPAAGRVEAFHPELRGKRLTFGHAGSWLDGIPLLYDRDSESLWCAQTEGLVAVAGPLRGEVLPRVEAPRANTWGSWRAKTRGGRLVVGADRAEEYARRDGLEPDEQWLGRPSTTVL